MFKWCISIVLDAVVNAINIVNCKGNLFANYLFIIFPVFLSKIKNRLNIPYKSILRFWRSGNENSLHR